MKHNDDDLVTVAQLSEAFGIPLYVINRASYSEKNFPVPVGHKPSCIRKFRFGEVRRHFEDSGRIETTLRDGEILTDDVIELLHISRRKFWFYYYENPNFPDHVRKFKTRTGKVLIFNREAIVQFKKGSRAKVNVSAMLARPLVKRHAV